MYVDFNETIRDGYVIVMFPSIMGGENYIKKILKIHTIFSSSSANVFIPLCMDLIF